MDEVLLARCSHHEGYFRGRTRPPLGLWSLSACRIVYVIEEEASLLKHYGFAFGTLPSHVERGEERFTVEWHRAEDSVFYEVFAFARLVHPLARVGPSFEQLVQRRFAAASLRAMGAAHHSTFQLPRGCRTPFREPLRFIVIAVMSVMVGTFTDTYGVFYVTLNCWRVRGPSRHRHGYRHRGISLGKRFSRYRAGHDAHDDPLRAYSRRGRRLYFVGPYPFNLPDEPDAQSKQPLTYAIFEATSGVGFV